MPIVNDPTECLRENLRKFRKLRGMTQAQMSSRSSVGIASISHFETGQRIPNVRTLVRLADALEVTVDTLLGMTPIETNTHANPVFHRASRVDAQTLETLRRIATMILADIDNSVTKKDQNRSRLE